MNPSGMPFPLSLISSVTQAEEPNIFPCSNIHILRSIRVLQGGILVEHKANVGILSRDKHDSSVEAILWFESIEVRALPLISCHLEQNSSKIFHRRPIILRMGSASSMLNKDSRNCQKLSENTSYEVHS